jgi:hypothetical protein
MRVNCAGLLALVSGVVLLGVGCRKSSQSWDSIDLKNDLVELQVVPEIGGRVIQYKLGDYGFFWVNEQLAGIEPPASGVGPNGEWLNYGGDKLWPAPQGWSNEQQWPGPPDPVLDGGPYTAEITRENGAPVTIRLTSKKDKRSGIQFSRMIKIFDGTTHVSIDATMKNVDTKPRRWGIWAHTQFDAGSRHGNGYNKNYMGYCPLNPDSIYRKGYNVMFGLVNNLSYKPDYENAMMRVHYQRKVGKIGLDSHAGWSVEFWMNGLGELVEGDRIIKMPEDPKDNPYVFESEVLSPYAAIDPGESYTFHYDWYAAKISSGSAVVACNDIGITCKPLSAELRDGRLFLDGHYGIFYKGHIRLVLLDENDNEIKEVSGDLAVTPLHPLNLSELAKSAEGITAAENAARVAIYVYDAKGQFLGELAETEILTN